MNVSDNEPINVDAGMNRTPSTSSKPSSVRSLFDDEDEMILKNMSVSSFRPPAASKVVLVSTTEKKRKAHKESKKACLKAKRETNITGTTFYNEGDIVYVSECKKIRRPAFHYTHSNTRAVAEKNFLEAWHKEKRDILVDALAIAQSEYDDAKEAFRIAKLARENAETALKEEEKRHQKQLDKVGCWFFTFSLPTYF